MKLQLDAISLAKVVLPEPGSPQNQKYHNTIPNTRDKDNKDRITIIKILSVFGSILK